MRTQCHEVLSAARSLGLRYYDAARSYGMAEEFLSTWLGGLPAGAAQELLVGSKWGYRYTAGWKVDTGGAPHEVKEHTARHLGEQAAETAGLLGGTGCLRLYQVHSASLESGALSPEVVAALGALRRERGWALGLTLTGVGQADTLRAAMRAEDPATGERLFGSVQATWNLLEQSAGPALLEARAAGMDVIVKEAMANGRLTRRNRAPGFAPRLEALCAAAEEMGATVDALALAVAMAQEFAPVVLSGATSPGMLESNAQSLSLVAALRGDKAGLMQHLMEILRQDPQEYWDERAALAWN